MNVGLIGFGFMGAVHIDAFAKTPDIKVAAICVSGRSSEPLGAQPAGGNIERNAPPFDFSQVERVTNWRELIADPSIDIVDVCLPTDLHAEVTVAALQAGKHVLCEKPMALSVAECERMLAAAASAGRTLMVGQVLRFWPEYVYLRDQLRAGKYGRLLGATFHRSCGLPDWSRWLPVESRSGGAVFDLLIHDIDQILMLFGKPSRLSGRSNGEVDTIDARFIYPAGPDVQLTGGWLPPGAPLFMTFRVEWERGVLELTSRGLVVTDAGGATEPDELSKADGYEAEIAYFVECCRTGRSPEQCPPQQSADAVEVALLLKESRAAMGEEMECSV